MGLAAAPIPESGKAYIFRADGKFFGQKPAAKSEQNGIHSIQRDEVPEIRDFY